MENYTFLLLTAGKSSRMGLDKGLLTVNGQTLIENHINNIKKVNNIAKIIAVCSTQSYEIYKDYFEPSKIEVAINKNPERGMFSSVLTGVNLIKENSHANLIIGNIDCSIYSNTINTLIAHYVAIKNEYRSKALTIIPEYNNTKGHPILLNDSSVDKLRVAHYDNRLDFWVEKNTQIERLFINDESIIMNINTPEDFEFWRNLIRL